MTKPKRPKTPPAPTAPLDRLTAWFGQDNIEVDVIILVILAVLTFAVFANVLNGDFVYDDTRQILQNPVVRDSEQFWSALTTDVWAFKSGGTEVVSDYWRPFFVFWLVINERLFGLENTAGWHITNVLLHIGTAVLAYIILRQLKISRPITTAIVLVFLLHPVHVETVSWISGSPDLLLALPILGAFSLLLAHQKSADKKQYALALLLFTLALLAKEAAILFPVLVFLLHLLWSPRNNGKFDRSRMINAARFALPFLLIAVLYLAARIVILGHITAARPWYQPISHVFLTIPAIIVFYLRQPLFPLEIGPSYPIRILTPETISFQNFWFPLIIVFSALVLLWWLIRRSPVKQFGLTLYFLFLLPSFNINAFHPEQIVHDRYLYLPLLGLLIVLLPSLKTGLISISKKLSSQDWEPLKLSVLALIIVAVLTIPLAIQTIRYNTAWKNELALWEWGVQTDPTSMLNTYLYGYYLFRDGRPEAAEAAMNTVIQNQPLSGPYYTYLRAIEAYLERADIAASQGRIQDARNDLELVIALSPANISQEGQANLDAQQQRAYERLALSYMQEESFETAVQTLEKARLALPQLTCTFTTNLAIILYLSGQKESALTELEGVQDRVDTELTPLCKMSLFYLGQLYLELGQTNQARNSLRQFLIASKPFYDTQTINLQTQANQILEQISGQ